MATDAESPKKERPGMRRFYLRTRIAELKAELDTLKAELASLKPSKESEDA
ncbi:hypothetical protein [Algicella marina]|uniref:Uncharacterized protein n=1 Tax=Algicella marina TaxID=2683284 RepID=A0A6P1STG1_9RHOB|nr:hypothetical protein [Algicella marina]QHQ33718.1 hypothetical protein GO499_00255 [Algicella marina]